MKKILLATVIASTTLINAGNVMADQLPWGTAAKAMLKVTGNTDYPKLVDSYMEMFDNDTYRKSKYDEFEMEEKRQETIEK